MKKQQSKTGTGKKRSKGFLEVIAKLTKDKRMMTGPEEATGQRKSPAKINLPSHLKASRTDLLGLNVCVY